MQKFGKQYTNSSTAIFFLLERNIVLIYSIYLLNVKNKWEILLSKFTERNSHRFHEIFIDIFLIEKKKIHHSLSINREFFHSFMLETNETTFISHILLWRVFFYVLYSPVTFILLLTFISVLRKQVAWSHSDFLTCPFLNYLERRKCYEFMILSTYQY